jgi:ATP-dependent Clp protease ATP-binding subunit ClpA
MQRANARSKSRGAEFTGTEDILLALVQPPIEDIRIILQDQGIEPSTIAQRIEATDEQPRSARAARLIELAQEWAEKTKHADWVGQVDLLLACATEEEGLGGRILRDADFDPERAHMKWWDLWEEAGNVASGT